MQEACRGFGTCWPERGVEQLAEQLANRKISYLILDLNIDYVCV